MSLINNYFFESRNVKVYPAAFRGNYNNGSYQFDPESRMPTEYNLIRTGGANGRTDSFIISWNNTEQLLKCVIGGYYFEISNVDLADFVDLNNNPKYLVIKTRTITLKESGNTDPDSTRTTTVLSNLDTESYETLDTEVSANTFYFTGIKVSDSYDSATAYLQPVAIDKNGQVMINYAAFLPNIKSGSGATATTTGFDVNSIQIGTNSEALGEASFASGNSTKAVGNYSTAAGTSTTAIGESSHAEGFGSEVAKTITSKDSTKKLILDDTTGLSKGNVLRYKNGYEDIYFKISNISGNTITVNKDLPESISTDDLIYLVKGAAAGLNAYSEGNNTTASGENAHAAGSNTIAAGKQSYATGTQTAAHGENSFAIGNKTTASGKNSYASGIETSAISEGAYTEGYKTTAGKFNGTADIGKYSHAEGNSTKALKEAAHAEGTSTTAEGISAHAEGTNTKASGEASHTEGYNTTASGKAAHAEGGENTIANSDYAHAEGKSTNATGIASHAEGITTSTAKQAAHAEGQFTKANGIASHAEGGSVLVENQNDQLYTIANSDYSHAEGYNTFADGEGSHTEGYKTQTESTGKYAHAEGKQTVVTNEAAHAEGTSTHADGASSHAEGNLTVASGQYSHTEGNSAHALSEGTHAEGNNTTAGKENNAGKYAHAEGDTTKASGESSHAEGYNTKASGDYAHSEGNNTTANGKDSHAEGTSTTASNQSAHAEGANTTAAGGCSHAEGQATTAYGNYSHAEGYGTEAGIEGDTTKGQYAHAEGYETKAIGEASHTSGTGTIANNDNEFVVGKYNKYKTNDNRLFVIGDGSGEDEIDENDNPVYNRKNAFEIVKESNIIRSITKNSKIDVGYNLKLNDIALTDIIKGLLLDSLYPVGSIYTSVTILTEEEQALFPKAAGCPIGKLGGKWERIQGRFLLSAGTAPEDRNIEYTVGAKGGNKDAIVVNHTHSLEKDVGISIDSKTLTGTIFTGRGEYSRPLHGLPDGKWNGTDGIIELKNGYSDYTSPGFSMQEVQLRPNQYHKPDRIKFDVSHKHTCTITQPTIESSGDSGSNANMPPYLVVYMWKRIDDNATISSNNNNSNNNSSNNSGSGSSSNSGSSTGNYSAGGQHGGSNGGGGNGQYHFEDASSINDGH